MNLACKRMSIFTKCKDRTIWAHLLFGYHLVLALAILLSSVSIQAFSLPRQIRLRSGFPEDDLAISLVMAKELMNPLGISHKNNLVVAENIETGKRVGWAQIRPLGYAGAVKSLNPSRFEDDDIDKTSLSRSLRDSRSTRFIEEDVEEMLWEEFEEDPTDFPNGLASLPWTKEYQSASQAATNRLRRRQRMLERELAARDQIFELSSVYVAPEWRNQGIGSTLVDKVLEQHLKTNQRGRNIYALTLAKSVPWYEPFGFVREKRIPNAMAMEIQVGRMITTLLREEIVCIRITL
ncbi:hypothetical protein ACHAWF_017368 [Thalassiosira exigua]